MTGRTVIIHTKKPDERSIRGVVYGQYADRWTLTESTLMINAEKEQTLLGLQHVPVENISFVQEVPE
jgi:hypothetical protein